MASKVTLCDNCMLTFMYNLSQDEILILNTLRKLDTKNAHASINETKIIPSVKDMTKYKFQVSIKILEAMGLVGRNSNVRPHSFWITPNGKRLLLLYKKSMKEG